jgi:hypothetical protein
LLGGYVCWKQEWSGKPVKWYCKMSR